MSWHSSSLLGIAGDVSDCYIDKLMSPSAFQSKYSVVSHWDETRVKVVVKYIIPITPTSTLMYDPITTMPFPHKIFMQIARSLHWYISHFRWVGTAARRRGSWRISPTALPASAKRWGLNSTSHTSKRTTNKVRNTSQRKYYHHLSKALRRHW